MISTSTLGRIYVLPGDVVSRIAAGEVIERPAAVVKELIENSLDAGSTRVTVEIKEGGLRLIRVTDNGEGMNRHDATLAFERHATSKLRVDDDLTAIRTMGFRGEALPSIASVSRVRMTTATRQDSVGTQLIVTAGTMTKVEDAAIVSGTSIEVEDLFFNQPARKKFMKSPATEFSHISHVVQQACLAWPGVQFRLLHNGQEIFNCPAVMSDRERVLQVYRSGFLDRSIEVQGERAGIRLSGFTVDAVHARASKHPQDLFVNRRPVRNATVWHGVTDGYGSFLAKGTHPVFVLFLDVDSNRVDVNVHPAKREVRFVDSDLVHQAVRQAVRNALGKGKAISRVTGDVSQPDNRLPSMLEQSGNADGTGAQGESLPDDGLRSAQTAAASLWQSGQEVADEQVSFIREAPQAYLQQNGLEVIPLGQVSRTFLVAQVGSELQVIDQHTAHERVLFERLWRRWQGQNKPSQPLLLPDPIDLPLNMAVLLQRYLVDLEKLGLVIEPFGTTAFLVRALPTMLGSFDASAFVQDLADDLSQWDALSSLEAKARPVMASLACHGAVRAGRAMALPEIKQLIEDWVEEGLIMTCPHGRRVALRLSTEELARMFGRA